MQSDPYIISLHSFDHISHADPYMPQPSRMAPGTLSPAAATAEDPAAAKEVSKILKKMGFPAQEAAANPRTSLTKVQTALTRRAQSLETLAGDLNARVKEKKNKQKPTETLERILGCFILCSCCIGIWASTPFYLKLMKTLHVT